MRRLPGVVQIVIATLAGVAVGLVWLASSGSEEPLRPERPIEVRTDITPDAHVFGEQVVATAVALVDASVIDPASVRVVTDFVPYELAGARTVERRVSEGVAEVTFRFPLHCLREGCDTSSSRGVATLETGRLAYRFLTGSGDAFQALSWPSFEVASRVSADDVESIRWRAAETTLPRASYRVDPTWLAALVLAVAAVLAAAAAFLAQRLWRGQPEVVGTSETDRAETRLARALALVREASYNGDVPGRRRALERVARELTAVNREELAGEARMLAWSSAGSTEEEVESLARRAEDGGS